MSTTFISHRMFVAALNHDHPSASPPEPTRRETAGRHAAIGCANQLTVEQLAAFAARHWPDLPFAQGLKPTMS